MVSKAPKAKAAAKGTKRPTAAKAFSRRAPAKRSATARESVASAVEKWLASMDLDQLGEARAALARTLATKLDQLLVDDVSASALAVPGTSRELREILDALQEASDDAQEFVGGLFSEVEHSAKS
jgi:ABC-type polar amino acid transport system ATPase subunit